LKDKKSVHKVKMNTTLTVKKQRSLLQIYRKNPITSICVWWLRHLCLLWTAQHCKMLCLIYSNDSRYILQVYLHMDTAPSTNMLKIDTVLCRQHVPTTRNILCNRWLQRG